LYNKLHDHLRKRNLKSLWKARISLKIKIWQWLICYNAIATKDNMKKGAGKGILNAGFVMNLKLFIICFLMLGDEVHVERGEQNNWSF
jgi:hypothetical protein